MLLLCYLYIFTEGEESPCSPRIFLFLFSGSATVVIFPTKPRLSSATSVQDTSVPLHMEKLLRLSIPCKSSALGLTERLMNCWDSPLQMKSFPIALPCRSRITGSIVPAIVPARSSLFALAVILLWNANIRLSAIAVGRSSAGTSFTLTR